MRKHLVAAILVGGMIFSSGCYHWASEAKRQRAAVARRLRTDAKRREWNKRGGKVAPSSGRGGSTLKFLLATDQLNDKAWEGPDTLSGGGVQFTYCDSRPGQMLELGFKQASEQSYGTIPAAIGDWNMNTFETLVGLRFELHPERDEPWHVYLSGGLSYYIAQIKATTAEGKLKDMDSIVGPYLSGGLGVRDHPLYASIGVHWRAGTSDVQILGLRGNMEGVGVVAAAGFCW